MQLHETIQKACLYRFKICLETDHLKIMVNIIINNNEKNIFMHNRLKIFLRGYAFVDNYFTRTVCCKKGKDKVELLTTY